MNKREVAEKLDCSTRQVEKYVGAKRLRVIEYRHGKTGREGVYDAAEVARLQAELEQERDQVIGDAPPVGALAAQRTPGGLTRLGDNGAEFVQMLAAAITQASARNHIAPAAPAAWLSLDQVSAWLGLPRKAIERALRTDRKASVRRIRETGQGNGLRLYAGDVAAYFEGL